MTVPELKALGFDKARDVKGGGLFLGCSGCNSIYVESVPTHEFGCANVKPGAYQRRLSIEPSGPKPDIQWRWLKVSKSMRGGPQFYQIRVPKGVRLSKGEWDTLLEWIGENTSGGSNYGYSITTSRLKQKSPKLRVLKYPAGLCASLMPYGEPVTTTKQMI